MKAKKQVLRNIASLVSVMAKSMFALSVIKIQELFIFSAVNVKWMIGATVNIIALINVYVTVLKELKKKIKKFPILK